MRLARQRCMGEPSSARPHEPGSSRRQEAPSEFRWTIRAYSRRLLQVIPRPRLATQATCKQLRLGVHGRETKTAPRVWRGSGVGRPRIKLELIRSMAQATADGTGRSPREIPRRRPGQWIVLKLSSSGGRTGHHSGRNWSRSSHYPRPRALRPRSASWWW